VYQKSKKVPFFEENCCIKGIIYLISVRHLGFDDPANIARKVERMKRTPGSFSIIPSSPIKKAKAMIIIRGL